MKTAGGEETQQNFVNTVDDSRCIGCQKCITVCGQGVFKLRMLDGKRKAYVAKAESCLGEGHCLYNCPTDAILTKI